MQKKEEHMGKHKALQGAIAAFASVATLGALAVPALADSASTYSPNGKSVTELAQHGGAQRIAAIGNKSAKNVVLFIGDGMGDSEITVARNYLKGVNGHFDGLDAVGQPGALDDVEAGAGQYTTFSLGSNSSDSAVGKDGKGNLNANSNPGKITAVTDSSASGSAWATGTKTYNNAVDVDVYGNPQLNLFELAKAAGKATGNVTTAEIQDATPAVLESHSSERGCYGPQGKTDGSSNDAAKRCLVNQLKENGGIGSISEQLLDTRADVTIGGGSKYFRQTAQGGDYAGKTLWDQAKERGYQTVENDVDAFSGLQYKDGQPVLALLSDGNMPTQYNPSVATKQDPAKDENPVECSVNEKWLGNKNASGNSASLADMTSKALDLLQANPKSQNGFFLQVEGASIDKQDHNGNACGQIGETDDLDKAISAALEKIDLNDTLVIVTADHAHTSQIVESQPAYALSTVLRTKDGSNMVVSYGTSEDNLYSDGNDTEGTADASKAQGNMSHTGTQLRIAASGPGASRVDGLTDQTDNFYTIAYALGLAADTDAQKALSNDGTVAVKKADDGTYSAELNGFNGDAVISYELKDKASGKVVAASNSDTPVSGVRVATGETTGISFGDFQPAEGASYTLTVTGRQSGKTASVDFPAASGTVDKKPGAGQNGEQGKDSASGTVAEGQVQKPAAPLGKTGAAVIAVALLAVALGCAALGIKFAKARR